MRAHSEILLSKCAQFREQSEFIDVSLKVDEEVFSAHRIVLAASSDYFHAMFARGMKESNQDVIELKDEGRWRDWAWRNQHCRSELNRKGTFDRRIEVPSPRFFLK